MGLSLDDTDALTVYEFYAAMQAHEKAQGEAEKMQWERTRRLAAILIQPHLKKGAKITPKQLIPLPWDEPQKREAEPKPKITREEAHRRFLELTQKNGKT